MALAWLFERQQSFDIEWANRLLAACGEVPWWIPGLWHLEVANALLVAERRSVLPRSESDRFLARLYSLPMLTDTDPFPERGARIMPWPEAMPCRATTPPIWSWLTGLERRSRALIAR